MAVVVPLSHIGIDVASFDESVQELAEQIMLQTRMYPALSTNVFVQAPLIMLAGTLLAAWIPALRVRRMRPVDALREEEMSDATLAIGAGDPAAAAAPQRTRNRVSIAAIAWRNLWRSKSRTWLMAGGIASPGCS